MTLYSNGEGSNVYELSWNVKVLMNKKQNASGHEKERREHKKKSLRKDKARVKTHTQKSNTDGIDKRHGETRKQ